MKGKTFGLLAVVLAIFLGSSAHAARISGTYSGTVVAGGSGMIGTLDASTVPAGTPVSGTFSYDSQIFVLGGLNEGGFFVVAGSPNPVVITITVGGSTFTVHGTIQSVLNLVALPSSNDPNNQFYLEAANWGASVPGLSGSIDLNLTNYLGAPFASNTDDPSSIAFTNQSGGPNEIDTLQAIDSIGNGTAALYFTITNSSTVSTPPAALLPALQTSAGLPHLEQPSNEPYDRIEHGREKHDCDGNEHGQHKHDPLKGDSQRVGDLCNFPHRRVG